MRAATSLLSPVGLLFLLLSQVACAGQSPAASPSAIATASPSATASATPKPTPTPTPTPSPTPGPSVLGNLQVAFVPATKAVKPPTPPIEVSLVLKPAAGGADVMQAIAEAGGGFSLTLDPGTYKLAALEISAPSMSAAAFQVPTGGPSFTVPATGCVYVGRIQFAYYRMPAGSFEEQTALFKGLFGREDLIFIFLESGGLIGSEAGVSLPPEAERVSGSANCSATLAKF